MKIDTMTVVPSAQTVVINDESYRCDNVRIDAHPLYGAVHALQWFGPHGGQIEYEKGPAGGITLDLFRPFIVPWRMARASALRARHDDIARNLEHTTRQIAEQTLMVGHLDEQVTALDEQLAEANEATRGGIANAKARLGNTLDRMKSELSQFEALSVTLQEKLAIAAEAAGTAESDLSVPAIIDQK